MGNAQREFGKNTKTFLDEGGFSKGIFSPHPTFWAFARFKRLKIWIWKQKLCVRNSAAKRNLINSWLDPQNKSSLADKMKSSEIFN